MLARMRNPKEPPGPPPAPGEPFALARTPPSGTLIGLTSPAVRPRPRVPAPAPAEAAPARPDLADLARTADGLRVAEGLRLELAHFRQWLPGQVVQLDRAARARRRGLAGQALAVLAGGALALLIALASGTAALSWPAYGRLLAHAARLDAPPAPAASR
jgi:hypothetical protein